MQHCFNYSMRAKYSLIILILLLPEHLTAAECDPVATLISLEGAVETKRADEDSWYETALKQEFCAGDTLRTGDDSRAAVRLTNETLFRLDGNSALTFSHIEKKSRSILDLLRGAVHFISRTPKSLEVKTPYVNALIEGTEFVVQIQENSTDVTVYEGVVVATNTAGSIQIATNQTARTVNNQAPVRITNASPIDGVTWALYYPPLPEQPETADTLAQKTVSAIAQNRLVEAAELAKQALQENNQSAAAYMAQSYVDQAQFNIPNALANSQKAAELAPQSALTQARLAEVWLMTGDTQAAQQTAKQAIVIDPKLALAHAVLGFASLREINLDSASAAFEQAIALDSAAPLPHLGLGLVKIRQGALQAGREEIETATLLDPGNALLRSYMGKAYFEERRNNLASDQFAMAKALDPNDPTAWFYDSILLQSDNRPVEALQAQQQAITLNDNRGVYRSRQLLDRDEAARSVALGRLYRDLGFEQLVASEGANSLNLDPANYSAHRLLSDSYADLPRYEVARSSELLQAQLLQPSNRLPIQPQLAETNLSTFENSGPGDISYNEYSSLFSRNRIALQGSALVAGNHTLGDEIIVSGLNNKFSYSLGQYHYETDGFRENSDIDYDLYNIFGQYMLTEDLSIQTEYKDLDTTYGDLELSFDPDLFSPNERQESRRRTGRIGLTYHRSPETTFIVNTQYVNSERMFRDQESRTDDDGIVEDVKITNAYDQTGYNFETQMIHKKDQWNTTVGVDYIDIDISEKNRSISYNTFPAEFAEIPDFPFSTGVPILIDEFLTESDRNTDYRDAYLYVTWNPNATVSTTLAGSYVRYEDGLVDVDGFNPKIGISLSLPSSITMRAAYFESIVRPFILRQTIEPTHVNGFNQLFDDQDGSEIENYGLAFEKQFSPKLFSGIELISRNIDTFTVDTIAGTKFDAEQDETIFRSYLLWAPTERFSFGGEYFFESVDWDSDVEKLDIKTHQIPLQLSYFHPNGAFFKLLPTYVKQEFELDRQGKKDDNFMITDIELGYRFANKHGEIRLGVKNLFDESFQYRDSLFRSTSLEISPYQPDRVGYLQISLTY